MLSLARLIHDTQHENVVVLDFESELIQLGMTRIRSYENAGNVKCCIIYNICNSYYELLASVGPL